MNMAARKTPSSVCDWIDGRRTDSGWMSGLARTNSGQRKSFQDARMANTEATPRMGLDIGSTIFQKSMNGAAPSNAPRSEDPRGRVPHKAGAEETLDGRA